MRFRNTVILTAGFGKTHIFLGFKFPKDHGGFYKGSFSLMLDKIPLCTKLLHCTSDSDPADMVKLGKLRLIEGNQPIEDATRDILAALGVSK